MDRQILISSPDTTFRQALLGAIEKAGVKASTVCGEMDLLLEVLQHDYSLVVYDLGISHGVGLKTVKILRRIRPKLSLAVLSVDPSQKLGGQLLQEGVTYYDFKPINLAAFCQIILNTLN